MITEEAAPRPAQDDPISTALVPTLQPDVFSFIAEDYQSKVARDLVAHLTVEGKWDYSKFNALNDYQRHLYALFLRLAGVPQKDIRQHLWQISVDVSEQQRPLYIEDVLKSRIVGFAALEPRQPLGVVP